jgi:predicted RNase H-like HicB family nuclease
MTRRPIAHLISAGLGSIWILLEVLIMRSVKYCLYREDPYFVAQGLSVDVSSFGKTREEAAANFREAVELYFEGEKDPDYSDISEVTVGEELISA